MFSFADNSTTVTVDVDAAADRFAQLFNFRKTIHFANVTAEAENDSDDEDDDEDDDDDGDESEGKSIGKYHSITPSPLVPVRPYACRM